jgi:hypothetical protein
LKAPALFAAALLAAGCEPQARRLLLVDFTLADPIVLEATAEPWHAAGYRVEYRRFYPHLTRRDLDHYRTVLVLGGREPERLSDALALGDLAVLSEWVGRGGAVVLGYTSDESNGTLDRWVMNRWLASLGTGIAIGATTLQVAANPQPRSALDNAGFAPFPAGQSRALDVREANQALARGTTRPLVAASRVDNGLVVVASRDLLNAARLDARSRDFLVALARWTRRPAEWAGVADAGRPGALVLSGAPGAHRVAVHPPPLAPPGRAQVVTLPQSPGDSRDDERPEVPGWINRQGMRVLWSRFAPYALDSLLATVDVAALNGLATAIPVAAIADTLGRGNRDVWRLTAERLQVTSLRWFPAAVLADISTGGADELDRHGNLVPVACGLDSLFWRSGLRPILRVLTRLGGARPELLAGVALDIDSAASAFSSAGFCDADFRTGLAALGLEAADRDSLALLPPIARYDTLLERGLLDRYYEALEAAVAERAVALRAELRRLHPDVRFAFRAARPPADWFSIGLLRGLATRESPALLWTVEQHIPARELQARYRQRGIAVLPVMRLDPPRIALTEWTRLKPVVFNEYYGFWLERAPSDSVGRLIRRLAK